MCCMLAHVRPCPSGPSSCSRAGACAPSRRGPAASTPIMFGMSWPIWFITWWVMWQCSAQSPGSSATNSIVARAADRHEHGRLRPLRRRRDRPAVGRGDLEVVAVQVDRVVVHRRRGCRGGCARARRARPTSGAVPGNALPLNVSTLKSVISLGSGRRVPGLDRPLAAACSAKSRSTRGAARACAGG